MNTRRSLLVALAWAFLVVFAVHFLDFPGSVPNFRNVSGGGVLLDASPAFTSDAVYQRLTAYGEQGRRNYSFRNVTIDVLLPLSVLPFLVLLSVRAVRASSARRGVRLALLAIPLMYVAFDLLENSAVVVLLANYPARMDILATALPYTTILKRIASLLALSIPLVILSVHFVGTKVHERQVRR